MKIWNDIACNLNRIEIQFNTYLIEFELRNGMQIDAQGTKNLNVNMMLGKKNTYMKKTHSHSSSL